MHKMLHLVRIPTVQAGLKSITKVALFHIQKREEFHRSILLAHHGSLFVQYTRDGFQFKGESTNISTQVKSCKIQYNQGWWSRKGCVVVQKRRCGRLEKEVHVVVQKRECGRLEKEVWWSRKGGVVVQKRRGGPEKQVWSSRKGGVVVQKRRCGGLEKEGWSREGGVVVQKRRCGGIEKEVWWSSGQSPCLYCTVDRPSWVRISARGGLGLPTVWSEERRYK